MNNTNKEKLGEYIMDLVFDLKKTEISHAELGEKVAEKVNDLEKEEMVEGMADHDCNYEAGKGEDGCNHESHKNQPEN